ncbi:alpha/beta hydrolase [Winogradskyella maritima]|uniref:Alpha/beta hydrolase n=1 Tax=Winogradskyella maritima TaxID=1517766 RepID=A0ABV8AID0_9FLAO|nr:alpha/beta hydrolase [Winogradskyella maritima]
MQEQFKFNLHHHDLNASAWLPVDPKAVVVLVHGLGGHKQRFEDSVVKYLNQAQIAVVACDLYGHGKSDGKRGDNPGYNTLMDLISRVVVEAKKRVGNVPLFLYGHSLGGNLVLNYSLRKPKGIAGTIATSPFLRTAFEPPAFKLKLGRFLKTVYPSMTLDSELDVEAISRDPAEVMRYKKDKLIHSKVSPRYVFPILDAGKYALKHAKNLKVPTLICHGTKDRLTDYSASEEFASQTELATLIPFNGAYHELHHDYCKSELIEKVLGWLAEQIA